MKTCTLCKETLPLTAFAKKRSSTQSRCRPCHNLYTREHYRNNKGYYIEKAKRRNPIALQRVHEELHAYLQAHPCVDCEENDPVVLQFDHVRGDKTFNIGSAMTTLRASWPTLLKEIEKCDVRCANCHIRRTASQFGWWRLAPMVQGI